MAFRNDTKPNGERARSNSRELSLKARRVVTPEGVVGPSTVEVRDGHIALVRPAHGPVPDVTLVPGFVDLQVNGLGSVHCATAVDDEWTSIGRQLAASGVTTWLPTVTTRAIDEYDDILKRIAAMALSSVDTGHILPEIAGVHLEGPFLGERPGAHPGHLIVETSHSFIDDLHPIVSLMTLGAEAEGAVEATRSLVDRGVRVAVGHTAASDERLDSVVRAGASLVTHLYNAMSGVHHRESGVASWALTTDAVSVSVIGDLHHVSARALEIALRCKPRSRLIAVSDSVAHRRRGLVDGGGGRPARTIDGTIAGSTIGMDGCYRSLVKAGAAPVDASLATATNPARLMGLADRGSIEAGRRADVVALDPDDRVVGVWVSGQPAHGAS